MDRYSIIIILIAFTCCLSGGCRASAHPPPRAQAGVLDLRQYDFMDTGSVTLSVEWKAAFK
ncbi:MAG: hypothetical protein KDK34_14830 [Leptospiraceae bacterium]|nr:hypothetical protein [Leptospiraceae bacterium]